MHELLGSDVVTEDGLELGRLVNVFSNGSSDVYEIKGNGKEVLLPAIEGVTKKVDAAGKRIVVSVPEGLLDEDAKDDGAAGASKFHAPGKKRVLRGKSK